MMATRMSAAQYCTWRAQRIYRDVYEHGTLQVRIHDGKFVTFKFPAPNGYGVRGELVAVYSPGAQRAWIEDDLLALSGKLSEEFDADVPE